MQYTIPSPAPAGDIVSLYSVAQSQANRIARAGSRGFNKSAFSGRLTGVVEYLIVEVQAGKLQVCNQLGRVDRLEAILSEAKRTGIQVEPANIDPNLTVAVNVFVRLD